MTQIPGGTEIRLTEDYAGPTIQGAGYCSRSQVVVRFISATSVNP